MPYITWGLIWDLKIKEGETSKLRRDPSCEFYHQTAIWDFKIKKGGDTEIERRKNFPNQFQLIIWDELKFEVEEILKVIYHVWDEIKILRQIKLNLEKGK